MYVNWHHDANGYNIGLHMVGVHYYDPKNNFRDMGCYIALRELGGIVTIGMQEAWIDFTGSWLQLNLPTRPGGLEVASF